MRLKIDLHVHTTNSYDGHTRPELLSQLIKRRGLDGVAITEHDDIVPMRSDDIIILQGIEVTTSQGHVIGLGLNERVCRGLTPEETIDIIHAQGGVAVIPHPHDPVCACVKPRKLQRRPDAIETVNADAFLFSLSRWLAERDARELRLPMVAGSDSHIPQTVGDAYTLVDAVSADPADILLAIKSGNVEPHGSATSAWNRLLRLSKKVGRWTQKASS